jgi:hypothetical protein
MLFEQEREDYYAQEACIDTLKYLILNNVPKLALDELEDDRFGFANVSPLEMTEHLRANSRVNDAYDVRELLDTFHDVVPIASKRKMLTVKPVALRMTGDREFSSHWVRKAASAV